MFHSLSIENFRGISKLALDQLGRVNVLVGDNGIGKSTILDALFAIIDPNDPELFLRTNLFRRVQQINEDFWKSFFKNFESQKGFTLKAASETERTIKVTPKIFKEGSLKNVQLGAGQKLPKIGSIIGLEVEFSEQAKTYRSSIAFLEIGGRPQVDIKGDVSFQNKLAVHYLNDETFFQQQNIIETFDKVAKARQKGRLIELLQKFVPTIKNLELGKNAVMVDDSAFEATLVNANIYGNGFLRALQIACQAITGETQILLIDEVENGLYVKKQKAVWETILDLVKDSKKQFFLTTHSYEMVQSLQQVAQAKKQADLVKLIRLQKDCRDKLIAVPYSPAELKSALESADEIR